MDRTESKKAVSLPWEALFFLMLGILLEIGAVVQRFYVENPVLNAVAGMIASLVLFYGGVRFLKTVNVGQRAILWVILSGCFYFAFRVVDVVESANRDFFARLLGVDVYFQGDINFDAVLRDVFIILSAMALLVAGAQALYLSFRSQHLLIDRNKALDEEVGNHKAAEARVRMSQETLRALINALSAAVLLVDREGRIVTHNRYFAEMLGDAQRDVHGKNLHEVMPAPLYDKDMEQGMSVAGGEEPLASLRQYNGRIYDVKVHPMLDSQGVPGHIAVLAQDITERIEVEQARALLETAINSAAEAVMITNKAGMIEYVNQAFEVLTGYCAGDACGQTPALLRSGHQDTAFYQTLWNTIGNGAVWRGEFVNRRKNGELFREYATISPIMDAQGEITHYVAVKRDITRERELEEHIQQAQKLDMIGTLAGGIAHDFNNVLAIILGHCELMFMRMEPEHPLRKNLEIIMRTASRSAKLTKRLLAMRRRDAEDAGPLPVAALIREQVNVVRVYLPSNVLIEESIPENVGHIHGEQSEVEQVLINLCTNASHAMQPGGGSLSISLDRMAFENARPTATGELAPGNYVRLNVCDTGCGMDEKTCSRIFEPFFTTKEPGAGTGMGLSMVHASVIRFGGAVDVVSEPGRGTQFSIYWPLIEHVVSEVETIKEMPSGDGRFVMVVDDMEDFTSLTELNLVNYGFRVKVCSSAGEALDFFRENSVAIDAVITDFMMPEANGAELARAIHAIKPDVSIILLTGYAAGISPENTFDYGISLVLQKPVLAETLARRLVEITPRKSESLS